MDYRRIDNTIIGRIDTGDSLAKAIEEIAKKENVKTAFITGVGAAKHLEHSTGESRKAVAGRTSVASSSRVNMMIRMAAPFGALDRDSPQ